MRVIQSHGVTIVVVSHCMELVDKFCEPAMLTDGGHLVDEGPPHEVILRYADLVGHVPEMAIWAAQLYLFSSLRKALHGVYTVEDWSVPLPNLG